MILFIFILGLITGSFLNVVIYRLPDNKSIIKPASHCPHCGHNLQPLDLIPVMSYIIYRGKCRYCSEPISWQYPVVEVLTGFLYLLLYFRYGLSITFFIYLLSVSLLLVCSAIDIKYQIIPNIVTYSGIICGLLLAIIFNHISIISSLLGVVIAGGFLFLIILVYPRGMGMGDVKLMAMVGAFAGWKYALIGIFIGSFLGSIIGIVLIVTGVIDRKTRIPFAPFLSTGSVIMILFGQQLLDYYLSFF